MHLTIVRGIKSYYIKEPLEREKRQIKSQVLIISRKSCREEKKEKAERGGNEHRVNNFLSTNERLEDDCWILSLQFRLKFSYKNLTLSRSFCFLFDYFVSVILHKHLTDLFPNSQIHNFTRMEK